MNKISNTLITLVAATICFACSTPTQKLTPQKAKQIAREAYIYGFPLVVNYKTMYLYAINKNSPEYKGEFNKMSCDARLFTPEDKAVVTPNSDTPYCMFWCDISQEPVVISVPDIEPERYYSFQLIDLYTHNFAYIGTLTSGNEAGKYLIATSDWKGEKPAGITGMITCETDLFFTVVRTQLMDDNDIDKLRAIQGQYQVQMLGEFTEDEATASALHHNFPVWEEGDQFTINAFKYLSTMLQLVNPVAEEKALMEKFALLGLGTAAGFDSTKFDTETLQAIKEGVKEGFEEIESFIQQIVSDPLASAKIFGTREFLRKSAKENYQFDNFYLLRATAAHQGLYGNSGDEATYPTYLADASGEPFNAARHNYTLTFEKDNLPPVKAFWSLSMYDGVTQLFIHNDLDRYLLNSNNMDAYVYNDDGSLTLYVQKESPGAALEPNWLPAPDGPFYCVMRLYGPEAVALSGEWVNPPLVKTK